MPDYEVAPRAFTALRVRIEAGLTQDVGHGRNGAEVVERPIGNKDFMASVCQMLGIDYTKCDEAPGGRPIRTIEKGEQPIKELLG